MPMLESSTCSKNRRGRVIAALWLGCTAAFPSYLSSTPLPMKQTWYYSGAVACTLAWLTVVTEPSSWAC